MCACLNRYYMCACSNRTNVYFPANPRHVECRKLRAGRQQDEEAVHTATEKLFELENANSRLTREVNSLHSAVIKEKESAGAGHRDIKVWICDVRAKS